MSCDRTYRSLGCATHTHQLLIDDHQKDQYPSAYSSITNRLMFGNNPNPCQKIYRSSPVVPLVSFDYSLLNHWFLFRN
jgi:hypothetical protein